MIRFLWMVMLLLSCANAANTTLDTNTIYQEAAQKIKDEALFTSDDKHLLRGCLDGMVRSVDKYGRYINEEEYETLYLNSKPVAGVGLFLTQKQNRIYIKGVVDDSSAQKAALQKGDEILQIDTVLVRELSLDAVISMLRGSPNTKVKLSILKANQSKPQEVSLLRKSVSIETLSSVMFQGGIVYIKINSFNQETLSRFLEELTTIQGMNKPLNGMILDVRDTPSGTLNQGLALTGVFLKNDQILVNIKSRHPEDKKQYKNTQQDIEGSETYAPQIEALPFLQTIPLVILINHDTAGSSEVVASVLQEYHRATIVGTASYGKDTFANLFPLSTHTAALKFSAVRWSTPLGNSVWPNGVSPNIEISSEKDDESVLQEALKFFNQ